MSTDGQDLQTQLAELRLGYVRQLPAKFSAFEKAFNAHLAAAWTEPEARETYRLIHSLAGSTGTYGFPEICNLARAAEAVVKTSVERRSPLLPMEAGQVRELLAQIQGLVARLSGTPTIL